MKFMEDIREIKTKQLIKNTFLKMLKQNDLSDITVSSISKKAGISRTTFYKHYQSVANLFTLTINDLIDETLDIGNEFFNCVNKRPVNKAMCEIIRQDERYRAIIESI